MPKTVLRPYSHLFRQGIIAIIAFMAPVLVVLYFLTIPDGAWRIVLATQITATVVVTIASVLFFTTAIWVDETGIAERGYLGGRKRYSIDEIGSVVLAHTYGSGGTESVPQLFVCDHEGRQLVRLRGQFWSLDSMHTVIDALGLPVTDLDDTVSTSELRTEYPGLLYWFERRPVLAAFVFVGATALFGLALAIVLQLGGVHTAL